MQTNFGIPLSSIDPTTDHLKYVLIERADCTALKELEALRKLGWESDGVHRHFVQQRRVADHKQEESTDKKWVEIMYKSMAHMDQIGRRFVRTSRFLDIGCCPGGYSTYILRTCPEATGVGISLPIEDGGHGLAIPANLISRINAHTADITCYDLAPTLSQSSTFSPLPFALSSFDFVVCDGHSLRTNPDNIHRPWNWTRLLVAQILLGLRAVSPSGTMFIKLSHVEGSMSTRLLLALLRVSSSLRTIKPLVLHADRSTFYVVAQGMRTSSTEFQNLVSGLQRLWYIMSFEGEAGYGRSITWEEQECVMPWEDVNSPEGLSNIVRLGTRVWQIQRDALRRLLQRRGVSTHTD